MKYRIVFRVIGVEEWHVLGVYSEGYPLEDLQVACDYFNTYLTPPKFEYRIEVNPDVWVPV